MDSTPPRNPSQLLNELEAIRQLLDKDSLEPPLLSEMLDGDNIPLLSEIIEPGPGLTPQPKPPVNLPTSAEAPNDPPPRAPLAYPAQPAVASLPALEQRVQNRLNAELRAAAELLLQDVIDDFVPKIEAELHRRLEARLERLIIQSKG